MDRRVLVLDGISLTCGDVAAAARGAAQVAVSADGRRRAGAAAEVAAYATARREVYGRTTGVGANRETAVSSGDTARHGLRLVRSHAGGGGPLIAAELSRGMLVVRVNQIAAGGSGVDPGLLDVLVDAGMRGLLAGESGLASRIQDPYGYRALPQVHGPAVDAARHAEQIVTSEVNAAAENPLIDVAGPAALMPAAAWWPGSMLPPGPPPASRA